MRTTTLRFAALAMAAAIAITGLDALAPDAAVAAPEPTDSEFVMTVFPMDSSAINFWNSWGARRSGGRRHQGCDIMSPKGTPVRAVADGMIDEMGHHRLSGYFIRLEHGEGITTSYMHLNNDTLGTDDGEGGTWTAFYPTLIEGAAVKAGDVIGYVGDSGNAEGTQPHVHFELRLEGRKTNPYPWLKDAWDRQMRLFGSANEPR